MIAATFGTRDKLNFNVSILFFTAALCFKPRLSLAIVRNGFSVRNLRLADVCSYFKLANESINYYFQVQFTHSGNNSLPCIFADSYLKAWVLLGDFIQTFGKLILIGFSFWFYRNTNYRFRELRLSPRQ